MTRDEIIMCLTEIADKPTTDGIVDGISQQAIREALELLKEQEAVEPDGDSCGECGYTMHRINYDGPDKELRHEWFRFCPSCGKEVRWHA